MTIKSRPFVVSGSALALMLYLLMFTIYAVKQPSALTVIGLTNMLNNTVVLALAAAGLTLVVLTGELDLSAVGVIAITNVVVATVSSALPGGAATSLLLVCSIGLCVGFVNGFLIAYLGLQSLACTLGTMIICEGIALLILAAPGGQVLDTITYGLTDVVGTFFPVAALILLAVALAWLYLRSTRVGIAIYAVGTDESASRLSGLDVRRTKLTAFAIAGVMYAGAGYMLSAQTGTGDPRVSGSFLLYVFASVAIGGTSLAGGRGGLIGSMVGAGILTVMQKMLFTLGVAEFYTNIFNGLIMILAIFIGNFSAILVTLRSRRSASLPVQGGQTP
jgi:ribose transport system permease protein